MKLVDKIKEKTSAFNANSWMLIYKHDKVILEKFNLTSDKLINLNLDDIKEARFFNTEDELKIWNYQGDFKMRLFSETQKEFKEYNETMLLQDCFKNKGTKIKVKNYYKYDENGLIQFQDARLTEVL